MNELLTEEVRKRLDLNPREFADLLNVHLNIVHGWARGRPCNGAARAWLNSLLFWLDHAESTGHGELYRAFVRDCARGGGVADILGRGFYEAATRKR